MNEQEITASINAAKEQLEAQKPSIYEKANALANTHKVNVAPMAFITEKGEVVIGYLKEPGRTVKMQAIDTGNYSKTQAGDLILRSGLIVEESDPRILDEKPENDPIYFGAISFAVTTIEMYYEQLKKK